MARNESLGFLETRGLIAAIEAADAMVKAARVTLVKMQKIGRGQVTVICEGDVASCQAAVNAGEAAAIRVGDFITSNVIARPAEGTNTLIEVMLDEMKNRKKAAKNNKKPEKINKKEKPVAAKPKASPKVETKPKLEAKTTEVAAKAKESNPKPKAKKAEDKKPKAK